MKNIKRWLAFFVVVILLIGVAFNSRSPIVASQIEENLAGADETAGANEGTIQGETEDPESGDGTEQTQVEIQEEETASEAEETTQEPHTEETKTVTTEYTYEDGEKKVIVTLSDGTAIPEGSELKVNELHENMAEQSDADKFNWVNGLVTTKATEEKFVIDGYKYYDIYFIYEGNHIIPSTGDMTVDIAYKQGTINVPESYTQSVAEGKEVKAYQMTEALDENNNTIYYMDDLNTKKTHQEANGEIAQLEGFQVDGNGNVNATKFKQAEKTYLPFALIWKENPKAEETVQPEEDTKTEDTKTEDTKTEDVKTEEETKPAVLEYEDDEVTITISAEKEGIIPKDSKLQVIPILPDDKETKEQYKAVEDQLNQKAENEEYDIAGFLAYDISFINEKGEEVEPDGDVKVVIDYKKEVIPEGIQEEEKEDLDVTVMHLEENGKGDVKKVVDMAADTEKETAVETTEKVEIKKAEFVTDSFSTFTVTWKKSSNQYKVKITSYYGYLDEDGEFRKFEDEEYQGKTLPDSWIKNDYTGGDVRLNEYSEDVIKDGKTYSCSKTKVSESKDYEAGKDATMISLNKESDEYYFYLYNNGWSKVGGALSQRGTKNVYIYFAYEEYVPLTTVETLDNAQAGITMKMKDLARSEQQAILGDGGPTAGYGGRTYYNVEQGILESKLNKDGFPNAIKNSGRSRTGGSLESLFNGNLVNHLFLAETYEQTGYYEYSSFQNYAYLADGSNFTVYNQLGTPVRNSSSYFYNRGNFFPYNAIKEQIYSDNRNLYDEDGNALSEDDDRYNERLYLTQGANEHFAMSLEANFYQPKDGIVNHKGTSSDMIFEFNGDDDLWVYIDDILVLDIGGIHDAHSGYINFVTGDVHVELGTNSSGQRMSVDTTIKEMYKKAGVFPDNSEWDEDKVDEYFSGDTFVDYSPHKMNVFYMERGAAASNLHMKFNLQTVPDGQIEITKNLANTDKENYANEDFKFELYVQKVSGGTPENPVYTDEYVQVTSSNLESLGIDASLKNSAGELRWNEDGTLFYLKPQQTATFSGLKANQKYYVKEVGVDSEAYDEVKINSVTVTEEMEDGSSIVTDHTTGLTDVTTSKEQVYKRPAVGFTNSCSLINQRELKITKRIYEGQTTEDTFSFKIQLSNQTGSLVPYSRGDYYLVDSAGNYYYYGENGKLVSNGTEAKVCGKTTEEGVVNDIQVGYTVVITKIISGTNFKVEEVNLDQTVYFEPDKNLKEKTYAEGSIEGADGEILLGIDAEITITNRKSSNTLQIKKIDAQNAEVVLPGAEFKIQKWNAAESAYKDVMLEGKPYTVTTSEDGMAVFEKLEKGKYKIIETKAPNGYVDNDFSFEIDLPYTKTNPEDPSIQVDTQSELGGLGQYATITKTVENSKKEWEIIKRSTSSAESDAVYLQDAEFELVPYSTSEDTIERSSYYGKSASSGKIEWYSEESRTAQSKISESDILAGTYQLKETKAPIGYEISAETWMIEIGPNGSFVSIEGISEEDKADTDASITCYFDNTPVYVLPEAGGIGTFWYTAGGTLLMALAGFLALYKNKRKRGAVIQKR